MALPPTLRSAGSAFSLVREFRNMNLEKSAEGSGGGSGEANPGIEEEAMSVGAGGAAGILPEAVTEEGDKDGRIRGVELRDNGLDVSRLRLGLAPESFGIFVTIDLYTADRGLLGHYGIKPFPYKEMFLNLGRPGICELELTAPFDAESIRRRKVEVLLPRPDSPSVDICLDPVEAMKEAEEVLRELIEIEAGKRFEMPLG